MALLKQIKLHPVALSDHESDRNKKMKAWQNIYIALVNRGMPNSTVRKVRSAWYRLVESTKLADRRSQHTKKTICLTKLQLLTKEILDNNNGIPEMPKVSTKSLICHRLNTYIANLVSYSQLE